MHTTALQFVDSLTPHAPLPITCVHTTALQFVDSHAPHAPLPITCAQIMAVQSTLEPRVGRRAVASVLRVMPNLLNTSSDTLNWHYEELAAMLGPGAAAGLAIKCVCNMCLKGCHMLGPLY